MVSMAATCQAFHLNSFPPETARVTAMHRHEKIHAILIRKTNTKIKQLRFVTRRRFDVIISWNSTRILHRFLL